MIKRPLKWATLGTIFGFVFVYLILAGFIWLQENATEEVPLARESVFVRSYTPHELTLIDDGLASLVTRLDLIGSAKKTLELEFFIYELDESSQLITQALVEAAGRGVEVKILVDFAAPVFKLGPSYARALSHRGIKVRYYNTAPPTKIITMQHRSHRKLLIADGTSVITGGRNIGNDYFNLSNRYNFLDSDVLIQGPIVKEIQATFAAYWDGDLTTIPSSEEASEPALVQMFEASPEVRRISEFLGQIQDRVKEDQFQTVCNDLTFVTDYPGVEIANRQVFRRLSELLGEATQSILAESPYFVLRPDGVQLMEEISRRGVTQEVLTNSLQSTDAYYTISGLIPALDKIQHAGVKLYAYDGSQLETNLAVPGRGSSRWGTHSKRAVIDLKHTVIGTYNVDPRSANFNSELILVCRDNPRLAKQVADLIEGRMMHSRYLFTGRFTAIPTLMEGASIWEQIKTILVLPLTTMFSFLL